MRRVPGKVAWGLGMVLAALLAGCSDGGKIDPAYPGYVEGHVSASVSCVHKATEEALDAEDLLLRPDWSVLTEQAGVVSATTAQGREVKIIYQAAEDGSTELAIYRPEDGKSRAAQALFRQIAKRAIAMMKGTKGPARPA